MSFKYVMQNSKKGLLLFGFGVVFLRINVLRHLWRQITLKGVSNAFVWITLSMHAMLCARPDICFAVRMSGYQSISLLEIWANVKHILQYLWRMRDYMFVSPCTKKLDFQSDEDSRMSTSRNVYTLKWFLLLLQQQRKPFGLWLILLATSSKILLCETVGWWHSLKNKNTIRRGNTQRISVTLL